MPDQTHQKTASHLTSGPSSEGEAGGGPDVRPHGTHYDIKRHRANGEELCSLCREFQRAYDREYGRLRRKNPVLREQMNAAHRRWYDSSIRANPRRARQMNARRRQRHRDEQRREQYDRQHLIDEVAVQRAVSGQPTPLNRAERLKAVGELRRRGYSYEQIAQHLGITQRQVHRDIADLGLTTTRGEVA